MTSIVAVKRALERRVRMVLMLIVPAVLLIVVAGVYLHGGRYVVTDNAYVKADKVPVSAQVSGLVSAVWVKENETVEAGQVLFRLDPAEFLVAVDKAQARLAQVRTDLAVLRASYQQQEAEISLARTRAEFTVRERQRQTDLMAKQFVSAAIFDGAEQNADLAQQQVFALEQDLHRIAEALGGSVNTPIQDHPSYLSAQAELAAAQLDLARVDIRAALAGTVSKPPKLGQYVSAGSIAMALVASADLWIEANITEADLMHLSTGQSVSVSIDSYPDQLWQGQLESLSPATGAEFSVIPAQNATGNWVKIAQRIPVRIRLAPDADQPALRAGLSAEVSVDTGYRRHLFGFSM